MGVTGFRLQDTTCDEQKAANQCLAMVLIVQFGYFHHPGWYTSGKNAQSAGVANGLWAILVVVSGGHYILSSVLIF